MTKKKIEQLYKSHTENTAPDMDALWERIESSLEEKNEEAITSKPIRRNISITKKATLAAACVAALIIVPAAVRNMDISNSDMTANSSEAIADEMADGGSHETNDGFFNIEAEQNAAADEAPAADDYSEEQSAVSAGVTKVNYDELELEPSEAPAEIPYGPTEGDDFFVEENVLIETDVIVNAYVDRVYSNGDGEMHYVIVAEDVETEATDKIHIASRTPYVMLENRCYILPLKRDGAVYSLAFENAPQIEKTLDGGYIFHNGWESLDENALDVIYPQGGIDDFFYDRMKFSYGNLDSLIERWHEIKD